MKLTYNALPSAYATYLMPATEFTEKHRPDLAEKIVHENADITSQFRINIHNELSHVFQTLQHTLVAKIIWKIVRPLPAIH